MFAKFPLHGYGHGMTPPEISTPGPEGLRALSHPVRLRLLGLLRTSGPNTATGLAQHLGVNSGATSYHLRQLAQHGFIEEDKGRGSSRERWWRAVHRSTRTSSKGLTPQERETFGAYQQAVAVVYSQQLQQVVEQAETLPAAWRRAGTTSDWVLRLTPERAHALRDALIEVITSWPEEDAPEAQPYWVNLNAALSPHAMPPAPDQT